MLNCGLEYVWPRVFPLRLVIPNSSNDHVHDPVPEWQTVVFLADSSPLCLFRCYYDF